MTDKNLSKEKIKVDIASQLQVIFDFVIEEKRDFFFRNPQKIPEFSQVQKILSFYGNQNCSIAGAVGLLPGPFGLAAAVPEISLILRNQVRMIYEIGLACGKSEVLSKETLIGVYIQAMDPDFSDLLFINGDRILVKKTTQAVFNDIVARLSGTITQMALESMTSKWLPFIGSTAMSTWSKISTDSVGRKAIDLFNCKIECADEYVELSDVEEEKSEAQNILLTKVKILALSNLMKIDGKIRPEELDFIKTLIHNSDLDEPSQSELREVLEERGLREIDLSSFDSADIESLGLIVDLVALAKRDGEFHSTEKEYIVQIGNGIGFDDVELQTFMELNFPEIE